MEERFDALEQSRIKTLPRVRGSPTFELRLHILVPVTPCVVFYGPSFETLQWPIQEIALSYATLSASHGYLRCR
jgi:hypothetical protein